MLLSFTFFIIGAVTVKDMPAPPKDVLIIDPQTSYGCRLTEINGRPVIEMLSPSETRGLE